MTNEADQLENNARWAIRAEVRRYMAWTLGPLGLLGFLASGIGGWLVHDFAVQQAESNFIKTNYQRALDAAVSANEVSVRANEVAVRANSALEAAQKIGNETADLLGEARRLSEIVAENINLSTTENLIETAKQQAKNTARTHLDTLLQSGALSWKDVTTSTQSFNPQCFYRARMLVPSGLQDLEGLLSGVLLDDGVKLFMVATPNTLANTIGHANDIGRITVSSIQRSVVSVRSRSLASDKPIRALEELCL